jgi:predicted oxidoreductase (fatty acid repression mutant protein)
MERTFYEALKHRRSYYAISNQSPVSDIEIEELIRLAVTYVPSAFNSQTTRIVLLLGKNHTQLWEITRETLRKIVPAAAFEATGKKMDSFSAGYGTVLYFEDQDIVKLLQENFPGYAENFPVWSQQTSAMHQFAIWTMLEDTGFGASVQHYNPLIDEEVRETWNLPANWKLIAQMPFGTPVQGPGEKSFKPLEGRVVSFR